MDKHIFLIGMMGCGKSTIAKLLAAKLSCPALDLDEDIVSFEGRSIPDIFSAVGDAGFRLCETAALRRACGLSPRVIATGGGIVTREENLTLMRENGLVVWLNRPIEQILLTVRQDTRPNLAGNKEERMRTLFAAREALYRKAAHVAFDNSTPPKESAAALAALLEGRA